MVEPRALSRRAALFSLAAGLAPLLRARDTLDPLLADLVDTGVQYFWDAADPRTGLVKDRALADGEPDPRKIGSIAATGFGLTALCIAHARKLLPSKDVEERVLTTLRFLWKQLPHEHGFFFHFVDIHSGERLWKCELSSIDTALLLCGVLTCRAHFRNTEIRSLAKNIYDRIDWQWMLNQGNCLSHGWKPESGFLKNRWDSFCEHMLLYLLAIGSGTHPIPAASWHAWRRPVFEYEGLRFITVAAPLFIHQYSHAWFDFRGKKDAYANYFQNSATATEAHRRFCLDLRERFPAFSEDLWGITASDYVKGYTAWGGPPEHGPLDGTVVPCAAAGSIPFLPGPALRTLHYMREHFGEKVWKRYGFIDAFNPHTNWFARDVIGIDLGITVLMAENVRSEFVWNTFMRNPEMREGMRKAGFVRA